ncbi:MAG: winged helix-turn-helix domain-containing protein [Actinomycetota bacterium]
MSTEAWKSPSRGPTTEPGALDYELADEVTADSPEQYKALADETRLLLLDLLLERAATTSHLAEALDKPKGTVGYHLKVLEKAGLIRIVRTRQVRAMTEKYYGRTGRTIIMSGPSAMPDPLFMVHDALRDVEVVEGDPLPMFTTRRARIPESRAVEYAKLLAELAAEFATEPREGERVYGFLAGVYPTGSPTLGPKDDA